MFHHHVQHASNFNGLAFFWVLIFSIALVALVVYNFPRPTRDNLAPHHHIMSGAEIDNLADIIADRVAARLEDDWESVTDEDLDNS